MATQGLSWDKTESRNVNHAMKEIMRTAVDGYFYRFIANPDHFDDSDQSMVNQLEGHGKNELVRFNSGDADSYFDFDLDDKVLKHNTIFGEPVVHHVKSAQNATLASFMSFEKSDKKRSGLINTLKRQLRQSQYDFRHFYVAQAIHDYNIDVYFLATTYDCPMLWMPDMLFHDSEINQKHFYLLGDFDEQFMKHFIKLDDSVSDVEIKQKLEIGLDYIEKFLIEDAHLSTKEYSSIDFLPNRFDTSFRVLPPVPIKADDLISMAILKKYGYTIYDFDDKGKFADWMNQHKTIADYLSKLVSSGD